MHFPQFFFPVAYTYETSYSFLDYNSSTAIVLRLGSAGGLLLASEKIFILLVAVLDPPDSTGTNADQPDCGYPTEFDKVIGETPGWIKGVIRRESWAVEASPPAYMVCASASSCIVK